MTEVREAVAAACRHLLAQQDRAGYWRFDQPTQVEVTAEDLLFREFAGLPDAELRAATARWLRSAQLRGGGWPARAGDPADPSASVLAYCALRFAGHPPDAYHMALAAGSIRDAGGLAATSLQAWVWLALFGEMGWEQLDVPPPEVACLAAGRPGLPGQPGWGRPAALALSVLAALRPARQLPFSLSELGPPGAPGLARPGRPAKREPRGRGSARAIALRACIESILAAQLPDGSWLGGGPQPHLPMLALHATGHPLARPAIASGMVALEARRAETQSATGPERWLDMGERATRGTALAVLALSAAGMPAEDDRLVAAANWLLGQDIGAECRWPAGRRGGAGRGPRDCATVLRALQRVTLPADAGRRPATMRAVRWLGSAQSGGGWWPDDGAGPSGQPAPRQLAAAATAAETTGEVLAALAVIGQPGSASIRRAAIWLLGSQLPDGAWPGERGAASLRATCSVLAGLLAAGVPPAKASLRRAVGWILDRQNPDGGWPDGDGACSAPSGSCSAPSGSASAPSGSASALLALIAAGGPAGRPAVERGAAWLVRAQQADGGWSQASPAALAVTMPLHALGSYLAATSAYRMPPPRIAPDVVDVGQPARSETGSWLQLHVEDARDGSHS